VPVQGAGRVADAANTAILKEARDRGNLHTSAVNAPQTRESSGLCRMAIPMLLAQSMATDHRELECWQLADQLRQRILQIVKRPKVARDQNFCDDIDRAINSACHNTAEGFYKFKHKPFAASLRIARGELGETRDQLESAAQKTYIDVQEHQELESLCKRALAANGGLIRFLDTHPDQ
jgi:four helix bundle protein